MARGIFVTSLRYAKHNSWHPIPSLLKSHHLYTWTIAMLRKFWICVNLSKLFKYQICWVLKYYLCWVDNVKERTSLPMPESITRASRRKLWKRVSAEASNMFPRRSNWSGHWTELFKCNDFRSTVMGWTIFQVRSPRYYWQALTERNKFGWQSENRTFRAQCFFKYWLSLMMLPRLQGLFFFFWGVFFETLAPSA